MDSERAPEIEAPVPSTGEVRGSALDVVGALLPDFSDRDAVLEIVRRLVAENEDMLRRLARIASRFKKSEKVGKAQLVLFLDALQRGEGEPETESDDDGGPDEVDEADAKLSAASGADELKRDAELGALKTRRKRQPVVPLTETSHLPLVPNPIAVPPQERACPACGQDRVCIGHDITRVIDYVSAKVVVRCRRSPDTA